MSTHFGKYTKTAYETCILHPKEKSSLHTKNMLAPFAFNRYNGMRTLKENALPHAADPREHAQGCKACVRQGKPPLPSTRMKVRRVLPLQSRRGRSSAPKQGGTAKQRFAPASPGAELFVTQNACPAREGSTPPQPNAKERTTL